MVEALRAELNRFEPRPRVDLPDGTTAERAELRLARERSRLEAHRSALRDVERLSGERSAARNDISRRLGMLDQTIDALSDDLRSAAERATHPQLKEATRISLLARREGAEREIDALRARLSLLDARGALIPWQIDQAQRRVARSEHVVNGLRGATRELRRREAESALERVRKQCAAAAETIEALAGTAAETEELADRLWGPEGVLVTVETAAGDIVATRKNLTDLDRIEQVTRRQFETVGYRGSMTRWWPDIPEEFPKPEDVLTVIQRLQERIPAVQHRQIRFEQQRSRAREVQDRALLDLGAELGEKAAPEEMRRARNLFNTRRDLLDRLMQLYGRYSNQLVELEALLQTLLEERQEFQAYLYERILWVRSVPRPVVPRAGDLLDAFVWLNSPGHWWAALRALGAGIRAAPGVSLVIAIIFGLLLGTRRRMRGRLGRLAARLESPETDSYRVTVEALFHTIGLAAPLPLALYIGSQVILRANAGPTLFAVGSALSYLASITALLELTRQIAAPDGLGRHFGWPSSTAGMLYGRLLQVMGVFLPLIYVALFFGMAGFRISSPIELRLYNNTLGRLAFITAMLFLGGALTNHFRPRMRRASTHATGSARPFRFQMLAYPVSILATIVPAALAVVGYYITGFLLAYQMLQTVWLLLGLLVLGGMLSRWNVTTRRDDSHAAALPAGSSPPGESGPLRAAQVRELFRFVLIVVATLGLYGVWSEAIPTVQLVKRVQIWPRIALLESTQEGADSPGADAGGKAAPGSAEKTGDGTEGALQAPPGMPAPTAGAGETSGVPPGGATLTLWQLLQSLLAFIVTWMLVKNVPGLLELLLRRRTGLESGVRIALGTLVRYAIMILGVSVALGLLGVTWGRIQWLAAALTFGLAFGL